MEDDARLPTTVNALQDSLAGKELWVAHDVFLSNGLPCLFINRIDIKETILQQIHHTRDIEERGHEPIAWCARL